MNKAYIMVVLALFVISGCSNLPKSDDVQVLREAAWNSLSAQDKQEVQTDRNTAEVESAKISDMPIPKGGGKRPEVEHLYKVSFQSNRVKTSGPIQIFVDGDTNKTVGYSKTVK